MANILKYIVKKDTTVDELLSDKLSPFKGYENDQKGFFDIASNDVSNLDRIWQKYTESEQANYANDYIGVESLDLIKNGTELLIDRDSIPVDLVSLKGKNIFIENTDVVGFWSDQFTNLNNDENNYPVVTGAGDGRNLVKFKNYEITVWIYMKSFDAVKDVTAFVSNLSTSTNMGGAGSFSFSLDGFNDIFDIERNGFDYISRYEYADKNTGLIKQPYYSRNIQKNDVVFIRFEKLALEKDRDSELSNIFEVDKNELDGKTYDMIGMIENVQEQGNAATNDVVVNVNGKDLLALLTEDAAYYYPIMFVNDSETLLFDTGDDSKWFKRTMGTGHYDNIFTHDLRSIQDSIGFLINQLSNLGVVPDDLFSGYGEDNENQDGDRRGKRRSQILKITGDNAGSESVPYVDWCEVHGLWQIVDVLVDKSIQDRRAVDSMLINSEGDLLTNMNSICQKPFVEFYGDTYGDKFTLIARQPPFSGEAIKDYIKSKTVIDIVLDDLHSINLQWETEYYTWYEIKPNNNLFGSGENMTFCYIPIVYLPEYADVFGNHRYSVVDSYLFERVLKGDGIQNDPFRRAVIEDFKYMIDSTMYLPFTRKGTVTISGDRRIKKGTFIRLVPTGEICYVEGVTQNYSSNRGGLARSTTLTLSRCMIEKYILDPDINYFNIVDTKSIRRTLIQTLIEANYEGTQEVKVKNNNIVSKANFTVNTDVFNFFLQREQFS